ncbi:hypothetical protein ACJX0J_037898, partial [Zea mays]
AHTETLVHNHASWEDAQQHDDMLVAAIALEIPNQPNAGTKEEWKMEDVRPWGTTNHEFAAHGRKIGGVHFSAPSSSLFCEFPMPSRIAYASQMLIPKILAFASPSKKGMCRGE